MDEFVTSEEISQTDLDAFDGEWDDVGSETDEAQTDQSEQDSAVVEESAETEENQTEQEPDNEQSETEQAETKDEAGEEDQLFTLNYMGSEKKVNLEEMTKLAQQGMDYERVRQERDSFKENPKLPEDYSQLQADSGYLKEIAELAGTTVEELVLRTRANKLMREDESLSEMDAVIKARASFDSKPEKKADTEKAEDSDDQNREKLKQFMETYPGVKAEDIPEEVWKDAFSHNGDLTGAYSRYENKQLKAEIAQLKQSQQNKSRSTGSQKSAGAATKKDIFDEAWDS